MTCLLRSSPPDAPLDAPAPEDLVGRLNELDRMPVDTMAPALSASECPVESPLSSSTLP